MYQARNRAHGTVTDVRSRTGNSTRSRNTAKHRRKHVSHTLAKKFGIGAVLGRGHTVSHHSAQKGFDGTENGNGQSRLEHLLHHFETNVWQVRNWETARNVVFHANGHHAVARNRIIPTQDLHHNCRHDNGNQGARHLRGNFRPQNANGQSHKAHNHSININSIKRRGVKLDFAHGIGRVFGKETQAKEVRHLAKSNNNSDTGGKAHGNRIRNKLNDRAKFG